MHSDRNARLQCLVEDPVLAIGRTKSASLFTTLRVAFFWLAVGTKLTWKKGQRGQSFDWISANFREWHTHPREDSEAKSTMHVPTGGGRATPAQGNTPIGWTGLVDGELDATIEAKVCDDLNFDQPIVTDPPAGKESSNAR